MRRGDCVRAGRLVGVGPTSRAAADGGLVQGTVWRSLGASLRTVFAAQSLGIAAAATLASLTTTIGERGGILGLLLVLLGLLVPYIR